MKRLKAEEEARKPKRSKGTEKKFKTKTIYDEYCFACERKNPPSKYIKDKNQKNKLAGMRRLSKVAP